MTYEIHKLYLSWWLASSYPLVNLKFCFIFTLSAISGVAICVPGENHRLTPGMRTRAVVKDSEQSYATPEKT